MSYELNNIAMRAPSQVINAIQRASKESGVDFSYLVQQASAESSFNPNASSKSSSATGLYQFIDSTWLSTIDKYGDDYGLNTTGKSKSEILNMRKDPKAASFMAAAFASENEKSLNNNWGGDVGATELYFAHFLGASGASAFLNARDENPLRPAADLFPRAARANRNVFYNSDNGKPKTLEEVYRFFDNKFQDSSDEINIAKAPIPSEKPTHQIADNEYISISRNLSNSIIMQKSQAMRDEVIHNKYGSIGQNNHKASPFFSLIAKPIDLMFLTQNVTRTDRYSKT